MSKMVWIVLGAIVLIAAGALYWSSSTPTPASTVDQGAASSAVPDTNAPPASNAGTVDTSVNVSATVPATGPALSATVTYDGSTFSPASVTIGKGGTVTFVDNAGSSMWVASAMHPSHTGYDDTSKDQHCAAGYGGPAPFDQCGAGASYSFKFVKAGTWGYHDHRNGAAHGTIIVQ